MVLSYDCRCNALRAWTLLHTKKYDNVAHATALPFALRVVLHSVWLMLQGAAVLTLSAVDSLW